MAIEFEARKTEPQAASPEVPGPVSAEAARRLKPDWTFSFGQRNLGAAERMIFTERLALLLETGVSLVEAIKVLRGQTDDARLAGILASITSTVSEGKPFSAALARHPEFFSQTYVSLVAAAEAGGFLPAVLEQLRDMDEKNSQMRSNIIAAVSYPAFLVLFSIVVIIFVLVFIFPKFSDLFQSIRGELPWPTLALMFASDMLLRYWWAIIGVLVIAAFLFTHWMRTPEGKLAVDRLKMRAPVVGEIYVQVYLSQTLGVLGMSLASGVPITVALKAVQDVVNNSIFFDFLRNIQRHVNEGRGVAVGFLEAEFVPPLVKQMIATGDETGNLAKVMSRVSDFYGRELNKRIAVVARGVEPIMLLVMGVVVGLIVASLILPIFKLSRAVH
ncbi:MAG: type II secretion system F family protein [Betaproteobacteria bacterium]|nr:type II secretion system F family protein [Betaproteobacteria bacterium]